MANRNYFNLQPHRTLSEQLSVDSSIDPASADSLDALPSVKIRGKKYVNDAHLARRGRGRSSWVANEGIYLREILPSGQKGNAFWVCNKCDEEKKTPHLFQTDATTAMILHLDKQHHILPPSEQDNTAEEVGKESGLPTKKKPRLEKAYPKSVINKARELAVGFIVDSNSPFTCFKNPFLEQLLILFNEDLWRQVPWSATTMASDLYKLFKSKKPRVKKVLQEAISHIHISFDLWTSPNNHAMMSIFAHFVNSQGKLARIQIGMKKLHGEHTGENQAALIQEVLEELEIGDLLCTVVCDNAGNNDTAVDTLFSLLFEDFTRKDRFHRRLRCFGHILNLVGHTFIYGFDLEAFETAGRLAEALNSSDLKEQLKAWRKLGPIGKLRNIVKWVRGSPQRSESFKKVEIDPTEAADVFTFWEESLRELKLILNNDTRWNSFYLMLERAILKRQQIEVFQFTSANRDDALPIEDHLSDEDWDILIRTRDILKPLFDQTMRCQGWGTTNDHGRLWEVLAGMEYLMDHFEQVGEQYEVPTEETVVVNIRDHYPAPARRRGRAARLDYHRVEVLPPHARADYVGNIQANPNFDNLQTSIDNAWKKLHIYYRHLSDSPLYVGAVILNPLMGLPFLERIWRPEWVAEARRDFRAYWERWYKHKEPRASRASTATPPPAQGPLAPLRAAPPAADANTSDFSRWLQIQSAQLVVEEEDELTRYLRAPLATVCPDQVAWWLDHKTTYPTLFQFALDILAIPSMATDCERSFSLAKLILTCQRLGMGVATLEEILLLQNWVRQGLVSIGEVILDSGTW